MIIRQYDWERARHLFSDEEKAALTLAVIGEIICPRGLVIDPEKLSPELVEKLKLIRSASAPASSSKARRAES